MSMIILYKKYKKVWLPKKKSAPEGRIYPGFLFLQAKFSGDKCLQKITGNVIHMTFPVGVYNPQNKKNKFQHFSQWLNAIYEEIIAILKAQVEEQERIIQAQDETIRVLQEHNEELAALLDHCCEDR